MSNETEIFSRPNTEAKIYDFENFTCWADTPNRPGFRARLVFGERNGAARISVMPNFEEGPKVLYVGMAPSVFHHFADSFERIITGPNGAKGKIDNYVKDAGADHVEGQPAAKRLNNTLHFGKDENGICWIGLEQANVPNIRFKLLKNPWHHFYNQAGQPITDSEGSCIEALGLIRSLRTAYEPFFGRLRPAWEKKGGGKKPAESGEGNKTKFTSFQEDDIAY